jgi:hypothetical protein
MLPTVNCLPDLAGLPDLTLASTAAREAVSRPRSETEAEFAASGRSFAMRTAGGRGSAGSFSECDATDLASEDTNEAWRTGRFLKAGRSAASGESSGVVWSCWWRRRSCCAAGFDRTARWTSAGCEAVAMALSRMHGRADED